MYADTYIISDLLCMRDKMKVRLTSDQKLLISLVRLYVLEMSLIIDAKCTCTPLSRLKVHIGRSKLFPVKLKFQHLFSLVGLCSSFLHNFKGLVWRI